MVHRFTRFILIADFIAACACFSVAQNPAAAPSVPSTAPTPAAAPAAPVANDSRQTELLRSDPSVFLGATLDHVFGSFGVPQSVRTARGPQAWQDDVVFIYDTVELYWFQDRVWQVRTNAAYGLRSGDLRETALSTLGEPLQRYDTDFHLPAPVAIMAASITAAFRRAGVHHRLLSVQGGFLGGSRG